jgi:hypothetical protein
MIRLISFAQAQSNWDAMLPPDDSKREAAFERECEAIADDPERLLAAVYEMDCDEAEKLAKLRIVLSDASVVLRIVRNSGLPIAGFAIMRDLLAASEECAAIVEEKIKQAAERVLS